MTILLCFIFSIIAIFNINETFQMIKVRKEIKEEGKENPGILAFILVCASALLSIVIIILEVYNAIK